MDTSSQHQWLKIANRVRSKVNSAWMLEHLAIPITVASVILTTAIVLGRRYWSDLPLSLVMGVILVTFICLIAVFLFRSKKQFETQSDALVRLETTMQMNASLSSAQAGRVRWPEVPEQINSGLKWNIKRLCLPFLGSLFLLISAFAVPVEPHISELPEAAPRSWQRISANIEELKEEDLIQEEYLKEMQKKLDELKNQPQKDWFSHPSLEASNNLEQSHLREVQKLSKNLENAEKSLNTLKKYANHLNESQKSKLMDQFNNAMKSMEKGQMKPNKELLEQLKNIDPNMLNNLSPEQMQQLRENMRNMSQKLKQQLREQADNPPGG